MSLFVSKLLPLLVQPLGAAIFLGLIVVALISMGQPVLASTILSVSLIGLWVASTPAFSYWLTTQLQAGFPAQDPSELPNADAVILLCGIISRSSSTMNPVLAGSADRLFNALRLFRAGNAPRILVCGGNPPWSGSSVSEAVLISNLLTELGVPRDDLMLEPDSHNTRESATNAAAIFAARGWTSGLVVTSATHMQRALDTFRRSGLFVTPAASDVHGRILIVEGPLDFLPDADALDRTTIAFKEVLGILTYRLRGWA